MSSDNNVDVQVGQFRVQVHRDKLEKPAEPETPQSSAPVPREQKVRVTTHRSVQPTMELDLRGWRVEEGMTHLERYLDDAYLGNLHRVRVIHGRGTGALRRAVRETLSSHPLVTSFRPGETGGRRRWCYLLSTWPPVDGVSRVRPIRRAAWVACSDPMRTWNEKALLFVGRPDVLHHRFVDRATILRSGFVALLLALVVAMALLAPVTEAQLPDNRDFGETGYSVGGEFLRFFDEHGGAGIIGPPVSGELMEDGVRVQYFKNARLELHPENAYPYRIQTGLLGDLVGESQPPIASLDIPLAGSPEERYYPQTGHTVEYGFLHFFDRHGGIDLFGYPISEMMLEPGGYVAQWFQKAQLEWLPDETGGRIQPAPLGKRGLRGEVLDTRRCIWHGG